MFRAYLMFSSDLESTQRLGLIGYSLHRSEFGYEALKIKKTSIQYFQGWNFRVWQI